MFPFFSRGSGVLFFIACLFLIVPEQGRSDEASDPGRAAYQEAQQRIKAGDFDGAVQSLQLALRHDFVNKTYTTELKSLREIIRMREDFAREEDSLRWNLLALHLRTFYQQNGITSELVDISLQIFDRTKLTWDAVCVINAMILAEQFDDALDFAASVDEKDANPSIQISKGFVLYSAERLPEARKLARSIAMEELLTSDDLLRLARLQAATELHASAVRTLVRCFELTPVGTLENRKERVVKLPEFEPLLTSSEFAEALTTRSKQASIDRACSQKWVGVVFDQRPKYVRELSKGPIKPDDWKIRP